MSRIQTVNAEAFRDSVFFSLSVLRPGIRRKVKNMAALEEYLKLSHADTGEAQNGETPAVDLPKSFATGNNGAVKVTKRLLLAVKPTKENPNPDPYENARSFLDEVKTELCGRFGKATPSYIKEGLFVVKKEFVQEFEDKLRAALDTLRAEHLPAVIADYPLAKQRAEQTPVKKGGLGPLYNEGDYCTPEQFANCFGLEWQWLALGIPEDLPPALRAEAQAKLETQFAEAAEEVKNALREGFQELIAHAAEKLKPAAPGEKAPQFKDSLIGNIAQFVECFQARNLMGDSQLEALVNQAKTVLTGLQPDRLRKFANVRETTRAQFEAIQKQLDAMIVTPQGRHFDLETD